jgi:hypothetical protein
MRNTCNILIGKQNGKKRPLGRPRIEGRILEWIFEKECGKV